MTCVRPVLDLCDTAWSRQPVLRSTRVFCFTASRLNHHSDQTLEFPDVLDAISSSPCKNSTLLPGRRF